MLGDGLCFGEGAPRAALVHGDAAASLATLIARDGAGFADVIYLDPPFGTGDAHGRRLDVALPQGPHGLVLPAYDDAQPLPQWLAAMEAVLRLCHLALAPHGTFYLHIDWRRGPHLRLLLDEIFGEDALRNEIVWAYGLGGAARDRFARKHDTILAYARDTRHTFFRPVYEAATSSRLAGQPKLARDVWLSDDADPATPIDRAWPDPVFEHTVSNRDPQRTGYPTQKPDALADRIVAASLPEGGLLLEPMTGSGAIGAAALRAGGRALLIDRGTVALDVCRGRCATLGVPWRRDTLLPTSGEAAPRAATLRPSSPPRIERQQGRATLRAFAATFPADAVRAADRGPLLDCATADARPLLSAWGLARRDGDDVRLLAWDDQGAARHRRPLAALNDHADADALVLFDLWGGWQLVPLR